MEEEGKRILNSTNSRAHKKLKKTLRLTKQVNLFFLRGFSHFQCVGDFKDCGVIIFTDRI